METGIKDMHVELGTLEFGAFFCLIGIVSRDIIANDSELLLKTRLREITKSIISIIFRKDCKLLIFTSQ